MGYNRPHVPGSPNCISFLPGQGDRLSVTSSGAGVGHVLCRRWDIEKVHLKTPWASWPAPFISLPKQTKPQSGVVC